MFSDWLKSLLASYGNIWIKYVGKIPGNGRFTIPDLLFIKNTVIVNYRDKRGKSREEFLFSKCVSDFCHDGLTTQIFISGKWVIGQ